MINRIADGVGISDATLRRVASDLKKPKIFSVVQTEDEAKQKQNALKAAGYNASYEKKGSYYNVLYSPLQKSFMQSLPDVKYRNFQTKTADGQNDKKYSFDDGSIWVVKDFDDGTYLVKEIDDNNEVVRQGKLKVANYITDTLNTAIINVLSHNDLIVTERLVHDIRHALVDNLVNSADFKDKVIKFASQNVDG